MVTLDIKNDDGTEKTVDLRIVARRVFMSFAPIASIMFLVVLTLMAVATKYTSVIILVAIFDVVSLISLAVIAMYIWVPVKKSN